VKSPKPGRLIGVFKRRAIAAPEFVPPMRATLVDKLPEGPEWMYEVKWDGYRALAAKHGDSIRLLSLKNKDLADSFPKVIDALKTVRAHTVLLDGEIVAVDANGHPSFQALQNRTSLGREWHIVYYALDLLRLEGEDLKHLPLEERKEKLKQVVKGSKVRLSAELPGTPTEILPTIKRAGLEGILAKRRASSYIARTRSLAWQKFKLSLSQELVIGGYNPDEDTFSSLLVGYYQDKKLMFAGKVRQGLTPGLRRTLLKLLRPLATSRCPFVNLPISKTGHFSEGITKEDMATLRWLRPERVAQVSFTEWTSYGLLRHATFLGLRDDKSPVEVAKEKVIPAA
jgi:bifunctional non-homologous end joining protein LigD